MSNLPNADSSVSAVPDSVEMESAVWVIEQLEIEAGQSSERAEVGRVVAEAFTTWPGSPGERWWRWLVESGQTLGLHCRTIDLTFDQLQEVLRDGGRLIVRIPSSGEWVAIASMRERKFLALRQSSENSRVWISQQQLRQLLVLSGPSDIVRAVYVEPQLSGQLIDTPHAEHSTPLARAWGLMRAESSDIRIVLIFALVSGLLALATPLAVEALVSTVAFGRLLQPIVVLALLLLGFLAFQAAIRGLQTFVVEIIQRRLFARVAADLAYRLPRANAEHLEGQSRRELVNRFFDIVTIQKVTAQLLLDGVTLVVNAFVGMLVLGFYHPWLLGFDIVLLAMVAFLVLVMGRGAVDTSIAESKYKYRVASWLEDIFGCPITFRYDVAAHFALGRTDRLVHEYLTARRTHFRILLRQILFALGLQAVASTVLLGLGGWLVIDGQLTLGQLVAAELILTVIVGSFAKLGKHMESYYDLMAAVDKVGHLLDLPVEIQSGMLSMQNQRPAECKVQKLVYRTPGGKMIFDGINLSIAAGERVVLTGTSGTGKSVLLDLLFGLRVPEEGYIEVDGVTPREVRPDILRRAVVLVRDLEMFEGTIAENIHLGRPYVSSTDVRVALEQVGLHDEILELPRGLETPINTTGHPLSANQMRKLILARAIAGRPTLLMVDGVLDGLPDRDSVRILEHLCKPEHNWTLLIITGRSLFAGSGCRELNFDSISPIANSDSGDTAAPAKEKNHGEHH